MCGVGEGMRRRAEAGWLVRGLGEAGDRGRKEGWQRESEEEPGYRRWWYGGREACVGGILMSFLPVGAK